MTGSFTPCCQWAGRQNTWRRTPCLVGSPYHRRCTAACRLVANLPAARSGAAVAPRTSDSSVHSKALFLCSLRTDQPATHQSSLYARFLKWNVNLSLVHLRSDGYRGTNLQVSFGVFATQVTLGFTNPGVTRQSLQTSIWLVDNNHTTLWKTKFIYRLVAFGAAI